MKKIALILALVISLLSFASCEVIFPDGFFGTQDGGEENKNPPSTDDSGNGEGSGNIPEGGNGETDDPNQGGDSGSDNGGGETVEDTDKDINATLVDIVDLCGLNEQIYGKLTALDGYEYKVYFRKSTDGSFTELDSNLVFRSKGALEFYVLGISAGKYDIKIEAEGESGLLRKTVKEIDVAAQDRSGYAHFGYTDGIGAYNSDGTVKEGTTILYVTNENKNTITMTINGTEYVGLVDILQKQYLSETPLLVRIIGKITTNQWNYKNVAPRLVDGSNWDSTFFDNTFSNEYGENLIGLKVRYTDKCAGKTYTYHTTADGLGEVRVGGSRTSTTAYKGSDFPALKGKIVYDDDSMINVIEVQAASNITIEGVGKGAELFQFGIGFEECNSIEIKNLTFTDYPEDALNFMGKDDVIKSGNYWIHNNTFNGGYNAWDITGERDKYAGDGTIDMAIVRNITISYNVFNGCKKTMLVGNSDTSRCMDVSIHHNHFDSVGSRLPLVRNTNVHSYNNFFDDCSNCSSVRVNSYLFSEANYFYSCGKPFDINGGAVKSYGDVFDSSSSGNAIIASSRDTQVSNSCKPDKTTDYSRFDTDPTLFYFNSEQGITDAMYLLAAEDVPDFVSKYAGAGVREKLPE